MTSYNYRMHKDVTIHPTADLADSAQIGACTKIWHQAQISPEAQIGEDCVLGKGVYIGPHVVIGNRVKIQNYVSVYEGLTIEDGVMVGPHVCFTNDMLPRAINPDGSFRGADEWVLTPTLIRQGVGLGANSTIRCGVTIGAWALVGAGSVVTRDVPDHGLVYGNPARLRGFVCSHGHRLHLAEEDGEDIIAKNGECDESVRIPKPIWKQAQ